MRQIAIPQLRPGTWSVNPLSPHLQLFTAGAFEPPPLPANRVRMLLPDAAPSLCLAVAVHYRLDKRLF